MTEFASLVRILAVKKLMTTITSLEMSFKSPVGWRGRGGSKPVDFNFNCSKARTDNLDENFSASHSSL